MVKIVNTTGHVSRNRVVSFRCLFMPYLQYIVHDLQYHPAIKSYEPCIAKLDCWFPREHKFGFKQWYHTVKNKSSGFITRMFRLSTLRRGVDIDQSLLFWEQFYRYGANDKFWMPISRYAKNHIVRQHLQGDLQVPLSELLAQLRVL